jgi:hypothetical protein
VLHTVPLRVKDAGDGYAPFWLPTNPMLTVLPPFGARKPSQSTGVTLTSLQISDQLAVGAGHVHDHHPGQQHLRGQL